MLETALRILSAAPTAQEKKQALANLNAEISLLETKLGLAHKLMPIFNADRAVKCLAELQGQLAAKGLTPAPAAAPPTAKPTVAATAPGEPFTLKATLAEFYKMDAATRAQFARDGGTLAKTDFDRLTLAARSSFCVNGGKILDDTPGKRNLSTAARSFGNS